MNAEAETDAWELAEKVIMVTGAGNGLGRAVAIALAEAGATVIASSRRRRPLEALDDQLKANGKTATLLPLDLSDPAKVAPIGPSIYERFKRLDGLVHCAAVLGRFMPVAHLDTKTLRQTIDVNLMGTQALIATLDPLLRTAEAGRALFLTDRLAARGKPFVTSYSVSKQAMEMLVAAYAAEVRETPLEVRLVAPPPLATGLRKAAFPGEPANRQLSAEEAARRLVMVLEAPKLPAEQLIDL